VARIRNTQDLEHLYASEPLMPEIRSRADLEVLGGPVELRFSPQGDLIDG
jgi:hypothetical protein